MILDPTKIYTAQIERFTKELKILIEKDRTIVIYRTITFLVTAGLAVYLGINFGVMYGVITGFICIALLMFWAKVHSDLRIHQKRLRKLIAINQNELLALAGDLRPFQEGNEYFKQIPDHPFQHDLDIFGTNSVYQLLNRTITKQGSDELATRLQFPLENRAQIENRQQEIQRLTPNYEFRQQWQATENNLVYEDAVKESAEYLSSKPNYEPSAFHRSFLYISIALSLAGLLFGIIASNWIVLTGTFVLISITSSWISRRQIASDSVAVYLISPFISQNQILLKKIIELDPTNSRIEDVKKVSSELQLLIKIINDYEARKFPLVGFLMNGFFGWDIYCIVQLTKWRIQHPNTIQESNRIVQAVDADQSLSTYAFNYQNYSYPKIIEQDTKNYIWEAKEIGHPLIPEKNRIENTFSTTIKKGAITIITGSNMAGKSTFLRTIGVNHLLATIGAPVAAAELALTPLPLRTSMRTMDALHKNESLFYAELKKLKEIIHELRKGNPAILLLDEILKGTNSRDKLEGSFAYVKQLVNLPTLAITATHDLELANLVKDFPEKVQAFYFDFTLIDEVTLKYDYKLKSGTPPKFNATILMKTMGVIPADDM